MNVEDIKPGQLWVTRADISFRWVLLLLDVDHVNESVTGIWYMDGGGAYPFDEYPFENLMASYVLKSDVP